MQCLLSAIPHIPSLMLPASVQGVMLSHNNLMYQVSSLGCCVRLTHLTLTACQAHFPAAYTRLYPMPVCTLSPSSCCCPWRAPALQSQPGHLVFGLQIANFTAFISPNPQDSTLSLLPPWHIYERAVGYYLYARACRQVRPAGRADRQSSTAAACVTFTGCHCSHLHAQAGKSSAALPGAPSVLVPFTCSSTPAQSVAHPLLHACWVMGCECSVLVVCLLSAKALLGLKVACSELGSL